MTWLKLLYLKCRYTKDSFSFLVKYLATFGEEDASTLSDAKEEAVRAIIEFVKSPDMFQVSVSLTHLLHLLHLFLVVFTTSWSDNSS